MHDIKCKAEMKEKPGNDSRPDKSEERLLRAGTPGPSLTYIFRLRLFPTTHSGGAISIFEICIFQEYNTAILSSFDQQQGSFCADHGAVSLQGNPGTKL